jgi:predicted lipase
MTEVYTDSQSKYTYNLIEPENQMFVFEVILKKFNNKTKIIRKIKKNKKGNIISSNDSILFSEIKELSLTTIDLHNPTQETVININLDHYNEYRSFINTNICLEIFSNNNFLECNYNFITL